MRLVLQEALAAVGMVVFIASVLILAVAGEALLT